LNDVKSVVEEPDPKGFNQSGRVKLQNSTEWQTNEGVD
jgi:hypothetical protein